MFAIGWSLAFVLVCFNAMATPNPAAIQADQTRAPEVLRVRVLDVQINPLGQTSRSVRTGVAVTAEVLQVTQTRTGLQPGQAIHINYTIDAPPPGVMPPTGSGQEVLLVQGREYLAYLVKAGDGYRLAVFPGFNFSDSR